jgi:hypothetical protein
MVPLLDDIQSLSRGIYFSKLKQKKKKVSLISPAGCTGCVHNINPYYGKATTDTCHLPYDYESFMPRIV